jgi:hypothetical protein
MGISFIFKLSFRAERNFKEGTIECHISGRKSIANKSLEVEMLLEIL